MHYHISYSNPHRHFIKISIQTQVVEKDYFELQLPAWRPGRYELGNFAKNIRDVQALDEEGQPLEIEKLTKDLWRIHNTNQKALSISYLYYANEVNAGSCFLDDHLFYVNPIQCCMYHPGTEQDALNVNIRFSGSLHGKSSRKVKEWRHI